MKKCLIVNGHPSQKSLVSAAVEAATDAAKQNGYEVRVVEAFSLPRVGHVNQNGYPAAYDPLAEAVLNSEVIIFATPVWWYAPTSAIKDFLDGTLRAGTHFRYKKLPVLPFGVPVGLLDPKKKIISITTTGGPAFFYNLGLLPNMAKKMIEKTFQNCGVKRKNCQNWHFGQAGRNAEPRAKIWLEKIRKKVF